MKHHFSLAAVLLTAACSSNYRVTELSPDVQTGDAISGVPIRVREMMHAEVYKLTKVEETYEAKLVSKKNKSVVTLNPNRIYSVEYAGMPFSSGTLSINLTDGALQSIETSENFQGSQAVQNLGTQLSALDVELDERRVARMAEDAAAETDIAVGRTAETEFNKALQVVAEAAVDFRYSPVDDAKQRQMNWVRLQGACVDANAKAVAVGERPPYPDANVRLPIGESC